MHKKALQLRSGAKNGAADSVNQMILEKASTLPKHF